MNVNYIKSRWYITEHVHYMWVVHYVSPYLVHYVSPYHMAAKFSFNTSFPTACSSANKTVGLPGWSMVEHKELIQDISYRVYLSSLKELKNNKWRKINAKTNYL